MAKNLEGNGGIGKQEVLAGQGRGWLIGGASGTFEGDGFLVGDANICGDGCARG
jgi:hypothetical protein